MKIGTRLKKVFSCICLLFVLSCVERLDVELISSLEKTIVPMRIEDTPNKNMINVFSDHSVVALGESTHGAKEFYLIKTQLIEKLIKEKEFKIIAIEAGFSQCLLINKYLHTGKGDVKKLVQNLRFYMYNTEEFISLLELLSAYNENQNDQNKVSFYGFDMQDRIFPIKNIINFFSKADSTYLSQVKNKLIAISKLSYEPNEEDVISFLNQVHQIVLKNKKQYIERTSEQEWQLVSKQLEILKQAEEYYQNYMDDGIRDKYMAENILWLMKFHHFNKKMIVWAHNGHISKDKSYAGIMDIFEWNNMGYYLSNYKEINYYALALEFYKGTILAGSEERRLKVFYVLPDKKFSFSNTLEKLNSNNFFIHFDSDAVLTPVKDWLNSEVTWHSIGGIYNPEDVEELSLKPIMHYDGVIYIEQISFLNSIK